jgi:hypothetical protein
MYHLADVDVKGTKMFKTSLKTMGVTIWTEMISSSLFENGVEISGSMKAESSLTSWANIRF